MGARLGCPRGQRLRRLTVGGSVSEVHPRPEAIAKGEQTPPSRTGRTRTTCSSSSVEDIVRPDEAGRRLRRRHGRAAGDRDAATGRLREAQFKTQGPSERPHLPARARHEGPDRRRACRSDRRGRRGYYAANAALWASLHQPDNLETTEKSLLIQEDPGSHSNIAAGQPHATAARIWRYDLRTGELEVVARVDQSQDTTGARLGAWESSGIVDASKAFGPGASRRRPGADAEPRPRRRTPSGRSTTASSGRADSSCCCASRALRAAEGSPTRPALLSPPGYAHLPSSAVAGRIPRRPPGRWGGQVVGMRLRGGDGAGPDEVEAERRTPARRRRGSGRRSRRARRRRRAGPSPRRVDAAHGRDRGVAVDDPLAAEARRGAHRRPPGRRAASGR